MRILDESDVLRSLCLTKSQGVWETGPPTMRWKRRPTTSCGMEVRKVVLSKSLIRSGGFDYFDDLPLTIRIKLAKYIPVGERGTGGKGDGSSY